jgi:hypothetical protein
VSSLIAWQPFEILPKKGSPSLVIFGRLRRVHEAARAHHRSVGTGAEKQSVHDGFGFLGVFRAGNACAGCIAARLAERVRGVVHDERRSAFAVNIPSLQIAPSRSSNFETRWNNV